MRRPTAVTVLLGTAALARAVTLGLVAPEAGDAAAALGVDPRVLVLLLDIAVPAAIATADHRGRPAAPTAAVALGSLGAGALMANGLAALASTIPLTPAVVASLTASALTMLAGAAAIGRWQDDGAPVAGNGQRLLRTLAVLGAAVLAFVLVTREVAVIGTVALDQALSLPGPVGVATTIDLRRLPLLVAALLPMAWVATRADLRHLRAVALVLGARAVVEAVADASLLALGAPLWPAVAGGGAAVALLVGVPVWRQVTSSSA